MAIKETTPTHTLGMPLHDYMHPPCCLSCVDTWFDKSLCIMITIYKLQAKRKPELE